MQDASVIAAPAQRSEGLHFRGDFDFLRFPRVVPAKVVFACPLIQRHGVAQILFRVGNPAAVKAQVLRVLRQTPDFVNLPGTRQHAQMPRVPGLIFADMLIFVHTLLLQNDAFC
jgi:hypothetical protein